MGACREPRVVSVVFDGGGGGERVAPEPCLDRHVTLKTLAPGRSYRRLLSFPYRGRPVEVRWRNDDPLDGQVGDLRAAVAGRPLSVAIERAPGGALRVHHRNTGADALLFPADRRCVARFYDRLFVDGAEVARPGGDCPRYGDLRPVDDAVTTVALPPGWHVAFVVYRSPVGVARSNEVFADQSMPGGK